MREQDSYPNAEVTVVFHDEQTGRPIPLSDEIRRARPELNVAREQLLKGARDRANEWVPRVQAQESDALLLSIGGRIVRLSGPVQCEPEVVPLATWIVHLPVAQRLIDSRDDLDPACVAVGSVAPDSGIPDEEWKTFDPPAHVTHFQAPESSRWPCADLAFYHEHIVPALDPSADRQRASFLLGYFSHLVVDNLCQAEITAPTESQYADQLAKALAEIVGRIEPIFEERRVRRSLAHATFCLP